MRPAKLLSCCSVNNLTLSGLMEVEHQKWCHKVMNWTHTGKEVFVHLENNVSHKTFGKDADMFTASQK